MKPETQLAMNRIKQLSNDGMKLTAITAALNKEKFTTATGKKWTTGNVRNVSALIAKCGTAAPSEINMSIPTKPAPANSIINTFLEKAAQTVQHNEPHDAISTLNKLNFARTVLHVSYFDDAAKLEILRLLF